MGNFRERLYSPRSSRNFLWKGQTACLQKPRSQTFSSRWSHSRVFGIGLLLRPASCVLTLRGTWRSASWPEAHPPPQVRGTPGSRDSCVSAAILHSPPLGVLSFPLTACDVALFLIGGPLCNSPSGAKKLPACRSAWEGTWGQDETLGLPATQEWNKQEPRWSVPSYSLKS